MAPAVHDWLPLEFSQWLPIWQVTTLALFTFVSEDLTCIAAALLIGTSSVTWLVGFTGCFLGIWLGDAGLYWLARGGRGRLLQLGWIQRTISTDAIQRSEKWFHERGEILLWMSRFMPGTRLPTYLAAGLLRLPFGRFLLITGFACLVWTFGLLFLARTFGDLLLGWLDRFQLGVWAIPLVLLTLIGLYKLVASLASPVNRRRLIDRAGRWWRWEFWPPWLFYPPVILNCIRLGLKFRGLALPTIANPGIETGGIIGESKMAMQQQLFERFPEVTAEAYLVQGACPENRTRRLADLLERYHFSYPFILKPDVGQRGSGVKLIRHWEQAERYVAETRVPLVLQRYVPGPKEIGVFFYRYPNQSCGKIFSITEKVFPEVTGDGRRTLAELIHGDRRARYMAPVYLRRFHLSQNRVPHSGEVVKLVRTGNHAQGCIFQDGAHLWTEALEQRMDEISQGLEGFFVGRYDLRYQHDDDLQKGRFKIIELNGAASEATNIYDARYSLFAAYRILFEQWTIVFAIGAANRQRGIRPMSVGEVWNRWRQYQRDVVSHPVAD